VKGLGKYDEEMIWRGRKMEEGSRKYGQVIFGECQYPKLHVRPKSDDVKVKAGKRR
jgi:hypothetical protein